MPNAKVYKRRKRGVSTRKRKRKTQKGGALARKRVRTVDKIAEVLSMFLSGLRQPLVQLLESWGVKL